MEDLAPLPIPADAQCGPDVRSLLCQPLD
jgi:hypothetical protein